MWAWVLSLMFVLLPPRQNDAHRLHTYAAVAWVIAHEAQTADDATVLIAIGFYESGYSPQAVGKMGEIGVWQLMPPRVPPTLRGQAREALRRWHTQGPCGYAGEPASHCVKGRNRALLAAMLRAAYPAPGDGSDHVETVANAAFDAYSEGGSQAPDPRGIHE